MFNVIYRHYLNLYLLCRGELQRLVGYHVPDSIMQKVASSARRLFTLQCTSHEAALIQERVMDGAADNYSEFGANILFQSPSRFVVDVPLEVDISLASDCGTTAPFHVEQYDSIVSGHHHSSPDPGTVSLRWLKDACDLIVKRGGSPLSGDELAMALCRVLLSNKAGDEVLLLCSLTLHSNMAQCVHSAAILFPFWHKCIFSHTI